MSVHNNDIVTELSEADTDAWRNRPNIDGAKIFRNGQVIPFKGACIDVTSPIINKLTGQRMTIGRIARNSVEDAEKAFEAASNAWNCGRGECCCCDRQLQFFSSLITTIPHRGMATNAARMQMCCYHSTCRDVKAETGRNYQHSSLGNLQKHC